jgi:succinyl-CoA synthetase alpha subunit
MAGGSANAVRRAYMPGSVGVLSRSGGMMTEIANLLTQSGIGQSTCVSIGGDPIIGSTVLDLLPLYEADPETKALALFCEPGGTMEERLAAHLKQNGSRLPIIAFVAGRFADRMQGIRFGHAGAIVQGTQGSPAAKITALREAGVLVADKLSHVPLLVREAIGYWEFSFK